MSYSRFFGLLALGFLITLLLCGCNRQDAVHAQARKMPAVAVRVVPAVTKDIPLDIDSIGNVEAIASVDVKSRIAGQVASVRFEAGQDVKAGQLLFQIDSEPLLRQVAELEANVGRDVAQEKQALANVAKDEAQLKSDKAKADRGRQLAKEGFFPKNRPRRWSRRQIPHKLVWKRTGQRWKARELRSGQTRPSWLKQTCSWDTRRLLRQFPAGPGQSPLSRETWSKTTTPCW